MPLLQGSSDSGNHFQALLAETFDGRVEKMLQWLEVFYSTQPAKSIFTQPEIILRHLQGIELKIYVENSNLLCHQVQFCGRIISSKVIQSG